MFEDMQRYTSVPLAFNCAQPDDEVKNISPIIFLHGITGCKEHWNDIPQAVANATKRKVYAIDARNHGHSEWSDVFNFDCNVDDLLYFMDYIRAPKAALVGHSMGGITAIKMAMRAPERVEKLVVEDMYVKKVPKKAFDLILEIISIAKAAILEVPIEVNECTAKSIIENYMYENVPEHKFQNLSRHDPSAFHLKRASDNRYCYAANVEVLENAMRNPETLMTENIGEYHGPAAFIYGENSPLLVGQEKESIKKSFPNAEFIKIENASHGVHYDFPAEFTKSLLEFLLK